jgi:hypothetical protein
MKNGPENKDDRSVGNYPYNPLPGCLVIADVIKSLGGNKAPVSRALLASSLKEDERSQTLTFKLASAKTFGLIQGRSEFSLTDKAIQYFYPTSESDKQNALLDFLESPPAFEKIILRFDGSPLPPIDILANILHRDCAVPDSWKERVAACFIKSAETIGAIDDRSCLRIKASRHGRPLAQEVIRREEPPTAQSPPQNAPNNEPVRHKRVQGHLNADSKTWSQTEDDRTIYIEHPRDLRPQEWQSLFQYIQRIKPSEPPLTEILAGLGKENRDAS